ncbi:hypothetical protein [Moritella viscosa]|uniref:HNH nuclease n=1 Tax=Moritella viscosa TaxID=80854 RepID=A0ABY1HKX8_9GAMM|nr:hypothetical protein [Moritella viscosa]SGZ01436.1 HNH nuclease [Moritella viscosa]SGZ16602.1 HNH nuclease [Moritella viscosa]SHO11322.1 HNH nuclease [Moritella viscosa]SHO11337.1 HNH nuclease [Moritella viscosa]SHO16100.1 HNH nuclease [Moritella viscosa]
MHIAQRLITNEIVSAQEACNLGGSEKYQCPSCNADLVFVRANRPGKIPYFRTSTSYPHSLACEYNAQGRNGLREIEFVNFLAEVMEKHPSYGSVSKDLLIGNETRYRADILADRGDQGRVDCLLIECKLFPPSGQRPFEQILSQLTAYKSINTSYKLVLAIPATLKSEHLILLKNSDIEVWDLEFLSKEFHSLIPKMSENYYNSIILHHTERSQSITREEKLISDLRQCFPGRKDCYVYQSLIGEILEHLFSPPLIKPISESSDKPKVNRRDFIMPNYVDQGFWAVLRERYSADYIIIDAKNYSKKVGKKDVLQVSNYLKPYGAGLFGLIISRLGGDAAGCEFTLREQWLVHNKMIIVLNDDDIISMLLAKSDGRNPEEILGNQIEQFRLSM